MAGTISPPLAKTTRRARCTIPSISRAERRGRELLLRTHTSPLRIRAIRATGGTNRSGSRSRARPIAATAMPPITPRCSISRRAGDRQGIHLGHLKWTLETFLKAFFERDDIVLRLQPSYFPFTEPSVEVDVGLPAPAGVG